MCCLWRSKYPPFSLSLQFLLIFRRAAAGELQEESGLMALARLSEINVSTEGVMGAKDFFEAKVAEHFAHTVLIIQFNLLQIYRTIRILALSPLQVYL